MAWVGAGEWLPDNDVAWLCILHGYLIEAIDLHIGEIEIFSPQPPSVSPPEVRQVDAAKMICVPEKRVAIHNAVVEPAPQQEWDGPELQNSSSARKPPRKPCNPLHLAISTRQEWYVLRVRVEYRHYISLFLGFQPVIIADAEILARFGVLIPAAEQSIAIKD